jgi:hypothetical protein
MEQLTLIRAWWLRARTRIAETSHLKFVRIS